MTDAPDFRAWLRVQIVKDELLARAAMKATAHSDDPGGEDRWKMSSPGHTGVYTTVHGQPVLCGPHDYTDDGLARHVINWQPARAFAECAAKLRIVDEHHPLAPEYGMWECAGCGLTSDEDNRCGHVDRCVTLRALALPYADRPGYREEWRP